MKRMDRIPRAAVDPGDWEFFVFSPPNERGRPAVALLRLDLAYQAKIIPNTVQLQFIERALMATASIPLIPFILFILSNSFRPSA